MDDEKKANFKMACIDTAASQCYKYDDENKRCSLEETEIVKYATAFYNFVNGDTKNV